MSPSEFSTLSLHDALPIYVLGEAVDHRSGEVRGRRPGAGIDGLGDLLDRKSTRLNSSHVAISYAVFCLKKKKKQIQARGILKQPLNQIVEAKLPIIQVRRV